MKTLEQLGLPTDERERIRLYYRNDMTGLRHYVLYMQALFDDRHEYLA